jgi:DnaJ-class molecular chaperone
MLFMSNEKREKVCDICSGTGQVSFFQGVSRFLLSTEECDACAGTGYQLNSVTEKIKNHRAGKQSKRGMKKTGSK